MSLWPRSVAARSVRTGRYRRFEWAGIRLLMAGWIARVARVFLTLGVEFRSGATFL